MAKKGAVPASVAKKKSTATKAAGGGSGKVGAAARPRVGVAEFVDFIGDWGTDEWVVMAVEAPREQVARAYARLARAKDVHESVKVRPAKKNDLGVISYLVPVVSTSGGAWTSILWITGLPIGLQDIETGDRIAGKLSAQFKPARTLLCRRGHLGRDGRHALQGRQADRPQGLGSSDRSER